MEVRWVSLNDYKAVSPVMRETELYHHGILGMKWGVRRYQNSDGSYTAAGKIRYGGGSRIGTGRTNMHRAYEREYNLPENIRERENYKRTQKEIQDRLQADRDKKRSRHAQASNYSEQQRTRDRKIYGKGAEKRINKRMLEGESIQSARHNEVIRKGRVDTAKKIGKTAAKGALVVGGSIAVTKYLKKQGFNTYQVDQLASTVINMGRHFINQILR